MRFLTAFRQNGNVTAAAKVAGIDRTTAYARRDNDPEFADAWVAAEDEATERLELEAHRRAFDGSDTLLIFLLKARRPAVYRERTSVEHTGKDGGPIETRNVTEGLTPDEREALQSAIQSHLRGSGTTP